MPLQPLAAERAQSSRQHGGFGCASSYLSHHSRQPIHREQLAGADELTSSAAPAVMQRRLRGLCATWHGRSSVHLAPRHFLMLACLLHLAHQHRVYTLESHIWAQLFFGNAAISVQIKQVLQASACRLQIRLRLSLRRQLRRRRRQLGDGDPQLRGHALQCGQLFRGDQGGDHACGADAG